MDHLTKRHADVCPPLTDIPENTSSEVEDAHSIEQIPKSKKEKKKRALLGDPASMNTFATGYFLSQTRGPHLSKSKSSTGLHASSSSTPVASSTASSTGRVCHNVRYPQDPQLFV